MRSTFAVLCLVAMLASDALAEEKTPQGLDEMARRKARIEKAAWPYADLTKAWSRSDWQPETLCFTDSRTGREIWRMTATRNIKNYYHNDIAMSPWSADGRRLAFQSWRAERGREKRNIWMVVDSTGARLRVTVNADSYCHWSPILPDAYYTFGGGFMPGVTSDSKVLYKVTVSDDGPATDMKPILTFPKPSFLGKLISSDGKRVLAGSSAFGKKDYYEVTYMPAVIFPEEEAKLLLPAGWTVNRDFGDYCPPFKGGHYHDKYLLGDGTWLYAIEREFGYWRMKTVGTAPDGGPKFTGDDGKGDFGEMIPEYVRKLGKLDDPWKDNQYPGHPGFDRWGELVNIANYDTHDEKGEFKVGCSVYDFIQHKPLIDKWYPQTEGASHCDWSAWSDYTLASVEKDKDGRWDAHIECFPYDKTHENFVVCYTNNFSNGFKGVGASYYGYIRPAQSPDGTKVAFHSDLLDTTDAPDCYWAVCFFPAPPTDLKAEPSDDGGAKLTWKMPAYTKRGWPKKNDAPPPAREVKAFHVWRSELEAGPWREVGAVDVQYKLNVARACREPVNLEFVDRPRGGEYHYAITTEEWSGLESRELSEVVRLTMRDDLAQNIQPAAKAGRKGFWTEPPKAPANFTAKKLDAPGQALLAWDEPDAANLKYFKVRYYNVYYSTAGTPEAHQENRIASLPVGTKTWTDWLADPEKPGFYAITSVDRQGNESAPVAAQP